MPIDKVERLADLVALLLHAGRPVPLLEIVSSVEGYPAGGGETARSAFERDKRELENDGIKITLEPIPGTQTPGYRIREEDYYLPDLGLTEEETVALNLAVAAVRLGDTPAEEALWKLGGVEATAPPLVGLPALPVLPVLHGAVAAHARARFRYGGKDRDVEPYALLFRDGFWYVVGPEGGTVKTFRVDRIDGDVAVHDAGAVDRPADFDAEQSLAEEPWLIGGERDDTVVVDVLVDRVHAARVEADAGADTIVERRDDGGLVVRLPVRNRPAFRSWLFGMLDHARVLAPPEVVDEVVSYLREMATP